MAQIPVESEQIPDDGILVPREIIRPFGRALSQLFEVPVSIMVNQEASLQRLFPDEQFASHIADNIEQLRQIFSNLESSREVWLVSHGGGHFTFSFSEEKDPDVIISSGEVIINTDLSKKLIDASSDTLLNQLTGIHGFSGILGDMAKNEEGKEVAEEIHRASQTFRDLYRQNFTEPGEFKVTTNDEGNSNITSEKFR